MRKIIFWEYRRGSRPYDIIVALILAFIFLTPREWFRDQPRPSNIVMLPGTEGNTHFWIEPELLIDVDEGLRLEQANQLLRKRTGRPYSINRLEPIFDAEQEIKGFMAYATP